MTHWTNPNDHRYQLLWAEPGRSRPATLHWLASTTSWESERWNQVGVGRRLGVAQRAAFVVLLAGDWDDSSCLLVSTIKRGMKYALLIIFLPPSLSWWKWHINLLAFRILLSNSRETAHQILSFALCMQISSYKCRTCISVAVLVSYLRLWLNYVRHLRPIRSSQNLMFSMPRGGNKNVQCGMFLFMARWSTNGNLGRLAPSAERLHAGRW